MSEPGHSDLLDDAEEKRLRHRAFLWTFGLCSGLPVLAAALALVDQSSDYGALMYLFAMPVVWGGAFIVGLGMWLLGDRDRGPGIMLGALAGAVVGFSLCSGVLWGVNAVGG